MAVMTALTTGLFAHAVVAAGSDPTPSVAASK